VVIECFVESSGIAILVWLCATVCVQYGCMCVSVWVVYICPGYTLSVVGVPEECTKGKIRSYQRVQRLALKDAKSERPSLYRTASTTLKDPPSSSASLPFTPGRMNQSPIHTIPFQKLAPPLIRSRAIDKTDPNDTKQKLPVSLFGGYI
jgi:hypothetical protein